MATRFERDVHGRPARPRTGDLECLDLGMRPAETGVKTLAHRLAIANDRAANHRVGLD